MSGSDDKDDKWLEEKAGHSIDSLKRAGREKGASPLARACAMGIPAIIAGDAEVYLDLTLSQIAVEWCVKDPVELLMVLAEADRAGKFSSGWITGGRMK